MSSPLPVIRISERADLDLVDIFDHIAEEADDDRAVAVLREIDSKIRLYATQPLLGRSRDELSQGLRGFPVYNYMVFYHPLNNGIRVVRVIHGSRDLAAQDYTNTGSERQIQ